MKLKGYRVTMDKTQVDFANLLGISLTNYCMKEKGQRKWKPSEMQKLTNYIKAKYPEADMQSLFFEE